MAEQNLESDQLEGSEGTTNSDASQNVGDKPTSTFNAEELLNKMRDTIKEEVGRATQSTKDKRFSEIEKKLGDFQPVLERFKDLVSPEKLKEIERDLLFEDMKQRVYGQTGETVSAGNAQAPAVNAAQVFIDEGLDPNDSRVALALNGKTFASNQEAQIAALRLSVAMKNSPTPTDAQSATLPGGAPHNSNLSTSDVDTKSAQLTNLYSNPTVNAKLIAALEEELEPYLPK